MGNWFADRLGAPPPPVVARFQPGQPWPPQQPGAYPQQPVLPGAPVQQQQVPFNPAMVQVDTIEQIIALKDAWQGTIDEKRNTATCPKCGGPLQMYTGMNAPKVTNKDGVSCHPMERCHYCGFNGHFEQLGQQATDSGVAIRVI